MKKLNIKLHKKVFSSLGGDGLSKEFLTLTFVHVLLMLGVGLSSVFISVFLFKMNGSDYVLTAKYNAYLFLFESLTFIVCLFFFKVVSVVKTMQLGLCFYSLSFIILLVFKNEIINYYIIVAFFSALGAGLYWTGYYLLLNEHTDKFNRQKALGFNGSCCYIASVIASPISGLVTSAFAGMTGYIVIFVITIIAFLVGAYYIKNVPYTSTSSYKINFHNTMKYIFKVKGMFLTYLSETFRGFRIGMTYYYAPILLYSITSNEFVLGMALMLKNITSIVSCNYMKTIKTPKQRLLSTILPLGVEVIMLFIIVLSNGTSLMTYLAFIYCSFYIIADILGTNLGQIPLFESMILLKRNCGTDREFMAARQLLFSSGRTIGVIVLLILPKDPVYQLAAVGISSFVAFCGSLVCNRGAKLISKEVENG